VSTPMTEEELRAARALCEAAYPAPWRVRGEPRDIVVSVEPGAVAIGVDRADGEFIAASRDLVPRLLSEVDRLRAEVARLTAERDEAIASDRESLEMYRRARARADEALTCAGCGQDIPRDWKRCAGCFVQEVSRG